MHGVHGGFRFCGGSMNEMRYFLCVMGMVMILEGLPYFGWPEKMKPWLKKILETPDGDLRKIGTVLVAMGLLLVYLGRS